MEKELRLLAEICYLVEYSLDFDKESHPELVKKLYEAERFCAEKFNVKYFEDIKFLRDL